VTLAPATAAAHGAPEAAVLVSGIAKPEGFRRAVERAGTRVASALVFPDHHRYTAADVRDIRSRGPALVTTEKDWVKLSRFEWDRARVWVARLDVELVGPDAVEEWLLG
jgi:tetraacyldisaccharide 4'-kinase